MIGRMRAGLYSSNYASDTSFLAHSANYTAGTGTKHVIVGCHGHGGFSYQFAPASSAQPGYHTPYLCDTAGYVVMGVDHAAINAWGDPNAMAALDDLYTYLTGTFLMPTAKIALQAWSMGGPTALNWALRNPTKVAGIWLWNPATDIRFWRDASGAYTPSYATAGITQGVYTSEINSTFAGSTTATGTATIPALGGGSITVPVTNARSLSDSSLLGSATAAQATALGVAFTYTGKTATSLLGCTSTTGSSIAVVNTTAITSAYATQSTQYIPWAQAAAYSVGNGITFPIKVCQASDDTTVPPAMNNDATNGFVARAANANITLVSPAPTGDHSASISNVASTTVRAFFDGLSW